MIWGLVRIGCNTGELAELFLSISCNLYITYTCGSYLSIFPSMSGEVDRMDRLDIVI